MTEIVVPEVVLCVGCGQRTPFGELAQDVRGDVLYFGASGTKKDATGAEVLSDVETGVCVPCFALVLEGRLAARKLLDS